ncbi:hypothetical protein AALP_AA3G240200 [Arabis alpina]|uniref:Uncharacterized protein n=1 Tax=Arabis alpina TaxID=50452 RepID=A0A087HB99_ARAAL|nr:hypothetical protein AALP_AA3G240200 [Arabis alpina]
MESQKVIWEDLKDFRLGSDGEPWVVHEEAQAKYIREHKLCLVAKGFNSDHQNPAGIKKAMPGKWGLIGKVEGQVTDEGHAYDKCPQAPSLSTTAGTLMEISHDPYATADERRVAIAGINSGQEFGESSPGITLPPTLAPLATYLMGAEDMTSAEAVDQVDTEMLPMLHGIKRSSDEAQLEEQQGVSKKIVGLKEMLPMHQEGEASTSGELPLQQTITRAANKCLVVAAKPPEAP